MSEKIPYHKIMRLSLEEREQIQRDIEQVEEEGLVTNGYHCRELERWFTEYYHCKYAITTANCTLGLLIALQAMRQQFHLDNVAHTPAFAWYSSQWALETAGFMPYYEDIDADTWIMYDKYQEFSLPVHTFGNTAQNHSKRVLYDGAHAFGAKLPDLGDATVISMAPTKIITSIEGGVILTDNDLLAANMVALRDKTARLSEFHAIYGNACLKHLKEVMIWKLKCNTMYRAAKLGVMQVPACDYNMNTIGVLNSKLKIPPSIETKKYYVPLVHGLQNTDSVYQHIVCLPSYFNAPVEEIIKRIKEANE